MTPSSFLSSSRRFLALATPLSKPLLHCSIRHFIAKATPNPMALKVILPKNVLPPGVGSFSYYREDDNTDVLEDASPSTLALVDRVMAVDAVSGLFVSPGFMTLFKKPSSPPWQQVYGSLYPLLLENAVEGESERPIKTTPEYSCPRAKDAKIAERVSILIQEIIQPVLERDGGAVVFVGYDSGDVSLRLQGACQGCPHSQETLLEGVFSTLAAHVPQVTRVLEV